MRSKSRLNSTKAALIGRGINSELAEKITSKGLTLSALQKMQEDDLQAIGLSALHIKEIQSKGRPPIPYQTVALLLWKNRFTCSICRDPKLAIIIHHIQSWSESKSHDIDNLAVLCMEHHARVHRRGDLEQNITPRSLKFAKQSWENEVVLLDSISILDASRLETHHWLWFNHMRLFEIATKLGFEFKAQNFFKAANVSQFVDKEGQLTEFNYNAPYRHAGSYGMYFYNYVESILESVLAKTAVFNVSDNLDRGFLAAVVKVGDIILVQGKHYFKQLKKNSVGPGQISEVRREANGVRISFFIDLWDAVSSSAWGGWLRGSPCCGSILRITNVAKEGDKLHLKCTAIAIGTSLMGLSTRSYVYPTWIQRDDSDCDENDNFLDGFGS